jgi:hypothetical protein
MFANLNDIEKELSPILSEEGLRHPLGYWIIDFIRRNETLYQIKGLGGVIALAKRARGHFTQGESITLYASIFADKEIFNLFFNYVSEPLQKGFRRLAEVEKIETPEMIALTGLDKDDTQLKIFPAKGYYWNPIYTFPPTVRKRILVYLDYFNFDLTPVEQLEKTDIVYHSTDYVFKELPILMTYIQQNGIATTQQGRPTSAALKKVVKATKIREFYPKEKGMNATIKTLLLLNLILELPRSKFNELQESVDILDYLLKGIYIKRKRNSIIDLFFSYKGIYKYSITGKEIENDILNKLKKLPVNGWLSFENVFSFFYQECDIFPIETYIAKNEVYHDTQYYAKDKVQNAYLAYVQQPFIKGTFFLLAALGIVDIAYDETPEVAKFKHDTTNPYDKLKYIRLNEFGAYLLGLNKDYTPPEIEGTNELYLSSEALVITTSEDNPMAEIILKNYMKKVSATRYMTDYEIFLSDCNSVTNIQEKINAFKKALNLTFPENWQAFFKEIIDKANRFQGRSYKVYELEKDAELIRLIARDEALKKLVIKAENYHILIKNSDLDIFKSRLLKFGYFLK